MRAYEIKKSIMNEVVGFTNQRTQPIGLKPPRGQWYDGDKAEIIAREKDPSLPPKYEVVPSIPAPNQGFDDTWHRLRDIGPGTSDLGNRSWAAAGSPSPASDNFVSTSLGSPAARISTPAPASRSVTAPAAPAYTGIDPIVRQRMGMPPATADEIKSYADKNPPAIKAGDGFLKGPRPEVPVTSDPDKRLGVLSGGQMDVINAGIKAGGIKTVPPTPFIAPPAAPAPASRSVTAPAAPAPVAAPAPAVSASRSVTAPAAPAYTGIDPIVRQRMGMPPATADEIKSHSSGTPVGSGTPGLNWTDSSGKSIQTGVNETADFIDTNESLERILKLAGRK